MIINLKKLNIKQKIVFNVLATFVIIVIIVYLMYIPAIENIKVQRLNILNQRMEIEKMYSDSKSLKLLKEKIERIEPQLKILDSIFINQNRELEFITSLESIANENNILQKINLNPEIVEVSKPYKITPVDFNLTGSFSNLINYLIDIETSGYYINVQAINMQASSDSSFKQNTQQNDPASGDNINILNGMTMRLSAHTYWK